MLDFIYVLLVASCFAFVGVLLAYLRILGAFTFLLGWVASLPIWQYFNPPEVIDLPEIRISSILHLAADKFLWDGESLGYDSDVVAKNYYADSAVFEAADHVCDLQGHDGETRNKINKQIYHFLLEFGYTYEAEGDQDEITSKTQGDRYMWLKFAAMVAEEDEAGGYKLEI